MDVLLPDSLGALQDELFSTIMEANLEYEEPRMYFDFMSFIIVNSAVARKICKKKLSEDDAYHNYPIIYIEVPVYML